MCRGYVISREKTTKLKIAGDNVALRLCDSRDYFASLLLIVQTIKLNSDFWEKNVLITKKIEARF